MRILPGILTAALALAPAAALAQQNVIAPNENLVVEGVPAIPVELAERVSRYTEFRSASPRSWHPTNREMLIGTRFADTTQVHLLRKPGGARTQLTFFREPVGGAAFQPAAPDTFLFSKDVGGNEFAQIYRFNIATGDFDMLTDGSSRNSMGPWSNDGKWMAYTSTRRNRADNDLYVVAPADKSSTRMVLEVQGGGWFPTDWSPDDKTLLVGEYVSANESHLLLVDVATGKKTALTTHARGDKVSYGDARYSRDGRGVYVTTDRDGIFQRLTYIDLATREHTYITDAIKWDVESFDMTRDGKTIAFVTNEDGISRLYLLDTASRKYRQVQGVPVGVIGGVEWHRNGRDLAFSLSAARSPADVYSLDAKTMTVERWTESETAGLPVATFSEPELVRWKSFDGLTVSGFLYRPPAKFTGPRPVVVNIHGGPESQFRPTFLGRNNYYLNELGVAIIFPNVRGSSGYGKEFLALDNGFKREDSVKDIGALLDWIKTRPELDASRVMVTGGSYGGYMTLAVATHYNDRIRAALDVVGISNFISFLEKTEAYRRDLRRVEYGDERDPEMRKFMERIAPVNNAQKITKPLFVVQGKNDPRVPLNEAEQMVATVRKNNTPVWYLMAKDEGHGFAKKQNADFQFYATVMFMQEYLLK